MYATFGTHKGFISGLYIVEAVHIAHANRKLRNMIRSKGLGDFDEYKTQETWPMLAEEVKHIKNGESEYYHSCGHGVYYLEI